MKGVKQWEITERAGFHSSQPSGRSITKRLPRQTVDTLSQVADKLQLMSVQPVPWMVNANKKGLQ